MTWVLVLVSAAFAFGLFSVIVTDPAHDCAAGDRACIAEANDVPKAFVIGMVVVVWFVVFVVLSLVWLMTRPRGRICPVCGHDVKRGRTTCKNCGHDFAAAGALAARQSAAAEAQDVRHWT